jgi:hypothetical protein
LSDSLSIDDAGETGYFQPEKSNGMKRLLIMTWLVMLVGMLQFCGSAKKIKTAAAGQPTTFEANVLPIIKAKCAPCHIPPVGTKKHLTDFAVVKEQADSILRRIQMSPGEKGFMPYRKSERLPDSLVQVFVKWKAEGFREN